MSDTPLEKLVAELCDTTGYTDAEIREELAEAGIDLDAEKAKFLPKLDAMMAARAGRQAIEALKATAPHRLSPMDWRLDPKFGPPAAGIVDRDGFLVAHVIDPDSAAHMLAATLAAPHLLARVAELEARLAKLTAPDFDVTIHPDGCFSTDPADAADCNGDGHYSCKSCKRLDKDVSL